mmetsp:Transcript_48648/g.145309  ORF Transcript_48648/g.145309 Transcript_48648/m.145309 type:complete len:281 (-) Transcript_48648:279-1121(-)
MLVRMLDLWPLLEHPPPLAHRRRARPRARTLRPTPPPALPSHPLRLPRGPRRPAREAWTRQPWGNPRTRQTTMRIATRVSCLRPCLRPWLAGTRRRPERQRLRLKPRRPAAPRAHLLGGACRTRGALAARPPARSPPTPHGQLLPATPPAAAAPGSRAPAAGARAAGAAVAGGAPEAAVGAAAAPPEAGVRRGRHPRRGPAARRGPRVPSRLRSPEPPLRRQQGRPRQHPPALPWAARGSPLPRTTARAARGRATSARSRRTCAVTGTSRAPRSPHAARA